MNTDKFWLLKWLQHSGICAIITVNPLHWRLVPHAGREYNDGWPSPNEQAWRVCWLFLTIKIWIDDGSW